MRGPILGRSVGLPSGFSVWGCKVASRRAARALERSV